MSMMLFGPDEAPPADVVDRAKQAFATGRGFGRTRAALVILLDEAGPGGKTSDEAERDLAGQHQSISARLREMEQDGTVFRRTDTRLTSRRSHAHPYVLSKYRGVLPDGVFVKPATPNQTGKGRR